MDHATLRRCRSLCPIPFAIVVVVMALIAAPSPAGEPRPRTFLVGDVRIDVVTTAVDPPATTGADGGPAVALVSVHDDEDTAVEAAREVLRDRGGTLVELRHTGGR